VEYTLESYVAAANAAVTAKRARREGAAAKRAKRCAAGYAEYRMMIPNMDRRIPRSPLRRLAFVIGAAVVCGSAACGDTLSAPPAAEFTRDTMADFQTDSLSYTLRPSGRDYEAAIRVVFSNRTADTAYFPNCGGLSNIELQKLVQQEWKTVWSPALAGCYTPPTVVLPTETLAFATAVIAQLTTGDLIPKFSILAAEVPGEYRIVWKAVANHYTYTPSGPTSGVGVALEHRISNRFMLDVAP
jgi:hypothetical protein